MNLVSPQVFSGTLTVLTAIGSSWALLDVYKLWKIRNGDRSDPLVRDQYFGYAIGILIGVVAVIGTLRYNGVV